LAIWQTGGLGEVTGEVFVVFEGVVLLIATCCGTGVAGWVGLAMTAVAGDLDVVGLKQYQ
jgi:hypothetical protein